MHNINRQYKYANIHTIYIYTQNIYVCVYIENVCVHIVTANRLKSQNGTLFLYVSRRGRLALDPLQNKSCSEFFSQAYKNWHIM